MNKKPEKTMNRKQFREELEKIMPGYKWTVHKGHSAEDKIIFATGIQSAGMNRMSTLHVKHDAYHDNDVHYSVSSSGFGKGSEIGGEERAPTLARAIRQLQERYSERASFFGRLANDLEKGRKK